ncbi:alpha/beta fold hydrolase [Nonomuraea jabiensis]|uniref:alpha/beta fold hydrolase n=1 Tax=Nonomuraea jabiensis TaxID=882448 RepID=UPI00367D8B28
MHSPSARETFISAITHRTATTRFIEANGISYAYRRFGSGGTVPLVLLQHFRGNLDNWDPALTDGLAASREVVLVDYPGVGSSVFPETDGARAAGLASLRRIDRRLTESKAQVQPETYRAQLTAIGGFAGFWDRQQDLTLPVLVANGAHDVVIHAYAAYAMSQRLPNAKIVLYSDAGHGFLFQHIEDFAAEVGRFLA